MTYGIYDGVKVIARFVTPLSVINNEPVFASDTLSLKRQVNKQGAQRWEIKSNLEPLSFTAEQLFVSSVTKGFSGQVQVVMPQNYGAVKRRTDSSTTVQATGSKDGVTLTISGNTGLIPMGTFIKISTHSKIYLTTSDISGNGVVGIHPRLRTDVSGILYYRDDVIGKFLYDTSNVSGMSYTDGILMDQGVVTLIEDIV